MHPNSMEAKIVNYFLDVNSNLDFFSVYNGLIKWLLLFNIAFLRALFGRDFTETINRYYKIKKPPLQTAFLTGRTYKTIYGLY